MKGINDFNGNGVMRFEMGIILGIDQLIKMLTSFLIALLVIVILQFRGLSIPIFNLFSQIGIVLGNKFYLFDSFI